MDDDDFNESMRRILRFEASLIAQVLEYTGGDRDRAISIFETAADTIRSGRNGPDKSRWLD